MDANTALLAAITSLRSDLAETRQALATHTAAHATDAQQNERRLSALETQVNIRSWAGVAGIVVALLGPTTAAHLGVKLPQ
jgi:hypothetical protein